MSREDSSLFVQSLATGLAVLDAFDAEHASMNLPEIAQTVGISRSAAQRFAYTLEALGLLKKDAQSKRFSLSPKALNVGYRYLQSNLLLERANPYLLDLNRVTGETVNLAEPDGLNMVYIGRFPSPQRSIVHMPVGRQLPIYCTSAGRAYLSGLEDERVLEILEASERPRLTPNTVTDIDALLAMIAAARESGFAYSIEEFYLGDLALAVPLFDVRGRPVAALNISVSTAFWSLEKALAELVPQLLHTANLISTKRPNQKLMEPFHIGYGMAR
ncbi:IclR family transcriptional regulator [Pseudomonas kuykendallii]|uniref:Transcriptional regulator, IclR family n=1 Tax=Pseudomonas kuykendallii TaxID=1007099 RepID=A0A1H2ZNA4_9PSED|nr:IclR family transcriptional regulator [Pseudomonas kuykendallii]MCQ4271413.1 IclR family transcriptional regulator [Pseudomonas kuykendallii]SDX18209.1 transcriptional regulator, IclR family [Pseudomonas kuykendallii]